MTDNVTQDVNLDLNAVPIPQTPPSLLTEAEQIESIKSFLFQGLLKSYQEFSAGINRLPADANIKRITIERLDDAWLWVKEMFYVLQIELPKSPEVPTKSQKKRRAVQKNKKNK